MSITYPWTRPHATLSVVSHTCFPCESALLRPWWSCTGLFWWPLNRVFMSSSQSRGKFSALCAVGGCLDPKEFLSRTRIGERAWVNAVHCSAVRMTAFSGFSASSANMIHVQPFRSAIGCSELRLCGFMKESSNSTVQVVCFLPSSSYFAVTDENSFDLVDPSLTMVLHIPSTEAYSASPGNVSLNLAYQNTFGFRNFGIG